MKITPLKLQAGVPDLQSLLSESQSQGFKMLERLKANWISGENRFQQVGEILLGVYNNEELIAVGGRNLDPYRSEQRIGRIRHVYVLSKFRRSGVGRQLMQELLRDAYPSFVEIGLRTDDAPARSFYESLGFRFLGEGTTTHVLKLPSIKTL